MNDILLEIKNLSKTYKIKNNKRVLALSNVNLKLRNNQIIGLLGKNGSGKTTFIKSCCNLITYKGEIYYNNVLRKQNCNKLNKFYSAVLEGNRNIYWKLTVLENIYFFASLRNKTKREILPLANLLLKKLDLFEKKNILVEKLSRGMQQKAALICSLVLETPVLFLDEPTLGLDIESIHQMVDFFNNQELLQKKIIIITSHNLDFITKVVKDVIIIKNGKILKKYNSAELASNQNLSEIVISKRYYYDIDKLKNSLIILKKKVNGDLLSLIINENNTNLSEIIYIFEKNDIIIFSIKKLTYDLESIYLLSQKGE